MAGMEATMPDSKLASLAARGPADRAELVRILGLAVLAVVILWWRWVGYQGHDDASYAAAAMDWVEHFPPLGDDHWALRYPLVLPIAGIIALTGPSVLALASVNLLAYAAFLAAGYLVARHWFGPRAAMLLTLIFIVLPQFPVQATYANPDLVEMSLTVISFWMFLVARERGGQPDLLFWSGVLAGLGFLTRETSLMIVVFYGLLYLFRPGMRRRRYLLMALGFALVVGAQLGYFAFRTGDPFYRLHISAHHDQVDRASKQEEAARAGRALDSEGVLATNPLVAPLAAVFVSQKYGLLFFLAIPAFILLRRDSQLTPRQRSVLTYSALAALVAFLFVALNGEILYVVPRYFMVAAALAAMPVAVLGARLLAAGGLRRKIALLGAAGFTASSLLLLYLENTGPMAAERNIAAIVAAATVPIHVDPETARRLHYLLLADGLQDRVSLAPPPPGSVVATEDGVVQACLRAPGCGLRERMQAFVPGPGWTEIARHEPPRRAIAELLEMAGLRHRIPADIWRKIEQTGTVSVIYRVAG